LKWPNDIYLAQRKLGGILCESAAYSMQSGNFPCVVVGIGLNINTEPAQFPLELQRKVISLYELQKKKYDLESVMMKISRELIRFADKPEQMHEETLAEWRLRDYLLGRRICWCGVEGQKTEGFGAGLLSDGRYGMRTEDGAVIPILGGELSLLTKDRDEC
jgi:BirA family biotin operon repressor/biotin-[acetyl-CoA-carboxylase] ligase